MPSCWHSRSIEYSSRSSGSSASPLLAASSFRLATITRNYAHLPNAYRALQLIKESINDDGWLLNTVDPETFSTPSQPGTYSPEGQAFVLLLHAAFRDFTEQY